MRIFVLTDCPSPYQVEFFNEIESLGKCTLEVGYLRARDPNRHWKSSAIQHECVELENSPEGMSRAREAARDADVVVFNYYMHSQAEKLIGERATFERPWCFWGERPGFLRPAWAGRLLRKWKLSRLHESAVPIWGIGKFAVDEYRREFGSHRSYFNLPYFSDLQRFRVSHREQKSERVFLFSGSLIARKGVELLARVFVRLANEVGHVTLNIVGEGELRQSLRQTLGPVSDRVEFVGFKDWNELPQEYARADVLCVPSRYDGWGLVVPEGLASGLPVIATDRMGAALEFIETGRNGWLIPAGDEDALFDAMREAALVPLNEMSQCALDSVKAHTLQNGAERFFRYAHEVVAGWSTSNAQGHKDEQ